MLLSSFIGRDHEVAGVVSRLEHTRLLTLTGVGGCGKTRLAIEVGRKMLPTYPDGVWLAELGPLSDPTLVVQEVGAVLGVREGRDQPLTIALIRALAGRRVLLVLDNCEHLLQACADLLAALLRGCPELHVLATSREPVGIDGEIVWQVPSLPVPDQERAAFIADLEHNPAVQLFVEWARSALPRFALNQRNAHAVAQICRRLDGIPLALELAAARIQALAPEHLAQRLDQRFRLLTGGSRAALPRQQTLEATLDWSYDLLRRPERRLFERLAVFADGWTLEQSATVLEECLRLSLESGSQDRILQAYRRLGIIARWQGQYERAHELLQRSIAVTPHQTQRGGHSYARSLSNFARVAFLEDKYEQARNLLAQSFAVIRDSQLAGQSLADSLDWLAAVVDVYGDAVCAARLFGAAEAQWQASGAVRYSPDHLAYERDVASVRAQLDGRAFAAAWTEGRAMNAHEATAYALEESRPNHGPNAARAREPDGSGLWAPGRPARSLWKAS